MAIIVLSHSISQEPKIKVYMQVHSKQALIDHVRNNKNLNTLSKYVIEEGSLQTTRLDEWYDDAIKALTPLADM